MNPLVSVIIPCFEQGRFLSDAIDSVLAQTYSNTEIIVVNDGSSDDTADVAKRYGARIRYFELPHSGPSRPRNKGLAEAGGEFIQFLDADDALLPTKLEKQVKLVQGSKELRVAYCDYYLGREDRVFEKAESAPARLSPRMDHQKPLEDLALRWETEVSFPPSVLLLDARIFRNHDIQWDESLPNHVDWDVWLGVFALPLKVFYIDEALAVYRVNSTSLTKSLLRMKMGFLQAIEKRLLIHKQDPRIKRMFLRKRKLTLERYDSMMGIQPWGLTSRIEHRIRKLRRAVPRET